MMEHKAGVMNRQTGQFVAIPAGQAAGMPVPTLRVGEIVEIKGVSFAVKNMGTCGRLGLRMLKHEARELPAGLKCGPMEVVDHDGRRIAL
jgi:hypothetical protein